MPEYNKRNKKLLKDKDERFYTNSATFSNYESSFLSITYDDKTEYLSLKKVLEILKGKNTPSKQILINRLSEYFYNSNGIYSSIIEKSVGITCFDRVITKGSDSVAKDFYISTLRNICEEYVGKTAIRECLKFGNYYGYLSYLEKNDNSDGTDELVMDDKLKLVQFSQTSIMPLNPKYITVLSTDGKTHRIGIDLSQLTQTDIAGLPKDIYQDVNKLKTRYDDYVIKKRKNKNTGVIRKQYYILDENKTLVIRLRANANEACGRAPFVTALTQMIYDNDLLMRKTALINKVGKKIIYETYPEGQKGKGSSALTQSQMTDQHNRISTMIGNLSTNSDLGFVSIHPNTQIDAIDINASLSGLSSDDILKNIGTHSGFSTGLLNGMDVKNDKVIPLLYEILSAEFDDFKIQWEKELNKVLRNLIKGAKDIMEYPYISYLPTNRLNRKDMSEIYRKSFSDAGGSYQLYLASTGIPAEIQIGLMQEEEELSFRTKYPAHPMASTSSFKNETSQVKNNEDLDNQSDEEQKVKKEEETKKGLKNIFKPKNKNKKGGNN